MRGVLQNIVEHKRKEIVERKLILSERKIKTNGIMQRTPVSMQNSIVNGSGVIAEFKRASPSKGIIRQDADPVLITTGYEHAGASGISVLTDHQFFQGSEEDLEKTRSAVSLPILRKDFTIETYQVYESKLIGADCILLIASILSKEDLLMLHTCATDIGLEVLVEIHEEKELDKLSGSERIVGINNRNLDTFEVDIENSIRLSAQLPEVTKIAESGLGSGSNLAALSEAGFDGFLVGESFMKKANPGEACTDFVNIVMNR